MRALRLFTLLFSMCLFSISAVSTLSGRVVGVTDGDTVTILRDNRTHKIRLHGLDCPEMGQDFGKRAKLFTSKMCYGKDVTVVVRDTDRYGRVVGEIILEDGLNLNQIIVGEGLGWWYEKYAPKDTTLSRLEKQARKHRRGLWAHPDPVAPWDFRYGRKSSSGGEKAQSNCEYWLNQNSNVRHNSGCKWFENTSRGRCCDSTEGKACGMCGG